jgi:hypothetical protein
MAKKEPLVWEDIKIKRGARKRLNLVRAHFHLSQTDMIDKGLSCALAQEGITLDDLKRMDLDALDGD